MLDVDEAQLLFLLPAQLLKQLIKFFQSVHYDSVWSQSGYCIKRMIRIVCVSIRTQAKVLPLAVDGVSMTVLRPRVMYGKCHIYQGSELEKE